MIFGTLQTVSTSIGITLARWNVAILTDVAIQLGVATLVCCTDIFLGITSVSGIAIGIGLTTLFTLEGIVTVLFQQTVIGSNAVRFDALILQA